MKQAPAEAWKFEFRCHEAKGLNWLSNRERNNYFIDSVEVLDGNFAKPHGRLNKADNEFEGRVSDIVYMVIDRAQFYK